MIQTPYISVAVPLPVPKTYTYEIPEHFRALCSIGTRVLVPFGRRRVTGYIVAEQKSTNGFAAKKILDAPDDEPLFPLSQVLFFHWIADYYLHPVGEVIKTALPSGLDQHDVLCCFLTDDGNKRLNQPGLPPTEKSILTDLSENPACPKKKLLRQYPQSATLLRKLEQGGLISVAAVLKKDTVRIKEEKYILPGCKNPSPLVMSKKRKQILEIVEQAREISLTHLKTRIPTAGNLIKPLAESGHITIESRRVFRDPLGETVEPDTPLSLTSEQQQVVQAVTQAPPDHFSTYLLNGVTGSGKTEVYLHLTDAAIKRKEKVLVLVPEISLISQTEHRFRARFGNRVAVIHSALTKGELLDQWRKIYTGQADIAIGARSCIFAPFDKIGLIIVDEEHDSSYKQETGLRYNARDLAVVRAKLNHCPVILGSATPSVQSYKNVVSERFKELKLTRRVNNSALPEITVVDLKKYQDSAPIYRILTPELKTEIRSCLERGDQALIFLNRRGFSTYPVCRDCGKSLSCKNCDITMTYHKGARHYRCHLCGAVYPEKIFCPECGSSKIRPFGFGTEKVESLLKELFPDARLARMDQDTTAAKGSLIKILKKIQNRTVDIVVGTQMLAKGHDFPSITLVGIVCADLALNLPDFRAGERTFQLLAQVAGRAGRGQTPGRVVMQTYNPDHFIIDASRNQDFEQFFLNEIPFRKALMYPPFTRMIQLKISGNSLEKAKAFAEKAGSILNRLTSQKENMTYPVQILGPIEAAISRISARFRWQILVKSPSSELINRLVKIMMSHPDIMSKSGIRITVDVDPYFLM